MSAGQPVILQTPDGGFRLRDAVVVMGVSGCGKTEVGEALARRLGWTFIEGDRLHPPANIVKMSAGHPLTDDDRAGWLDAVGEAAKVSLAGGRPAVVGCSALKRVYRDRLRGFVPGLAFVCLAIDRETALRRVGQRRDHFMPASLVDSQFAALELPATDENALIVDGTKPIGEIVQAVMQFRRD